MNPLVDYIVIMSIYPYKLMSSPPRLKPGEIFLAITRTYWVGLASGIGQHLYPLDDRIAAYLGRI